MRLFRFLFFVIGIGCYTGSIHAQQPIHADTPFGQEISVKSYRESARDSLVHLATDRNGKIQVIALAGLRHPHGGAFLQHGVLVPDVSYRFMTDKKIAAVVRYQDQLVYLSDKAIFSNAWAGSLYAQHQLPSANRVVGGADFTFLISDGAALHLVTKTQTRWKGQLPNDRVLGLRFHEATKTFWVLGSKSLSRLDPATLQLTTVFNGTNFTAFDLTHDGKQVVIGTSDGYLRWDIATRKPLGDLQRKLPATHITAVADLHGSLWFGTTQGAFSLRPDGKYNYYNGERWLPSNHVIQLVAGAGASVLLLTTEGLAELRFSQMTLHEKAMYYEQQVRSRHIRNGFNASLVGMQKGNLSTGYLADSDNDGLWTSMYLASQVYRYTVTKEQEALLNCTESLEAMERLYTINGVKGFPSRSFERSGHIAQLSDPERWQHSKNPEWDWKATTSSDEAIGHIFVFGVMAELLTDQPGLQRRAVVLIDSLMQHILDNDLYLVDYDGKPTAWGRWNPDYVNALPAMVGDRKINSSNIIAMLQTAYRFTQKERYREKALELLTKHGYYQNLMRPMREIGVAPESASDFAKMLSEEWNHSDDEMYFLGYWGLYRYALNDTLRERFKESILDHWQAERPEKEGAWNLFTALTGVGEFDLAEAVWYLQEHPLDLITWQIENSHRKDIEKIAPNFRGQTLKEVLPPDERPIQRHNANMFTLDSRGGRNGTEEYSAGDIWLLPYWLGRYLGVFSGPKAN